MQPFARVALLDAPISLDRPFDYHIPEHLRGDVVRGSLVYVPFSGANKRRMGVVVSLCSESESEKTKDILDVNRFISLDEEQMAICRFLKEYTLCTTGDAVRTLTPPFSALKSGRGEKQTVFARRTGPAPRLRGEKQTALYNALTDEFAPLSPLFAATGTSMVQLRALTRIGAAEIKTESAYRNPYADLEKAPGKQNVLSPHQAEAYRKLCALYESGKSQCALLFGVTGSGKTRVMKEMIDRVCADGKSVIVLVPEISLTPQTVGIFCAFYGERVAVLHSSLSAGERFDAYRRIAGGEVDVVIGTRSAVFAPLQNLGMIIIDEEQEHTYKSDSSPKYHARDVAAFRLGKRRGLLLLASATPSVESFYKAKSGVYTLVELTERYGGATLPTVRIDDMRFGALTPFGKLLTEEMQKTLAEKNQAILFLNRRGYNAFLSCRDCGEAVLCPHCSVSLTRHKTGGRDYLLCHYCGFHSDIPRTCPACGKEHLAFMGFGTQKAEEAFAQTFSGRILRMDADTTTEKAAYDKLLGDFRARGADVLLGTQMVAKGHDFPDVTLVGVLNADALLYMDDFRAGERTFSLLTQVIGRAGRAGKRGTAVIQTMNPKNQTIRLAAAQDYRAFYAEDIKLRRAYTFPPFCDIAVISVTAADEERCTRTALEVFEVLKSLSTADFSDVPILSFGPFEAPVFKVSETYRMRLVLKCRRDKRLLELLRRVADRFTAPRYKGVGFGVDINPSSV
ncbi:MAG: primosomal protein N' [Clostridia bacterium]|nr:primosomal protein N' [Clostridia bacterium]